MGGCIANRTVPPPLYKIRRPRKEPPQKKALIYFVEKILGRQVTDSEMEIILTLARETEG